MQHLHTHIRLFKSSQKQRLSKRRRRTNTINGLKLVRANQWPLDSTHHSRRRYKRRRVLQTPRGVLQRRIPAEVNITAKDALSRIVQHAGVHSRIGALVCDLQ